MGMWLRAWAVAVTALLMPMASSAASAADAIVGTWLTDDGDSKVEIAAAKGADGGAVYSGRVAWLKEPLRDGQPLRDANNADAALRERPILGLTIVAGFKPNLTYGCEKFSAYAQ